MSICKVKYRSCNHARSPVRGNPCYTLTDQFSHHQRTRTMQFLRSCEPSTLLQTGILITGAVSFFKSQITEQHDFSFRSGHVFDWFVERYGTTLTQQA